METGYIKVSEEFPELGLLCGNEHNMWTTHSWRTLSILILFTGASGNRFEERKGPGFGRGKDINSS